MTDTDQPTTGAALADGLQPCPTPWCKHDDSPYIWQGPDDLFQVVCSDCRVHGPSTSTEAEARDAWDGLARDMLSLIKAGNNLSFHAQTSGGTAGRDNDLVEAINAWAAALRAPAQVEGEAVCANCEGTIGDLAPGRDPDEFCDTCYQDGITALTRPTAAPDDEAVRLLEWLGQHTNFELSHYSPMRCDDDDDAIEWRVHSVNGGINDREWTQIGSGQTPLAAIAKARAYLTRKGSA